MQQQVFARRRQALMELIGNGAEHGRNPEHGRSIALLPAAPVLYRNRGIEHPYRQDSYLYYLTGFTEPEALAVILPGREQGQYLLFCRENDPEKETWEGRRAGLEGACQRYGADDAFPITDIDDIVPGLMEGCKRIYHGMGLYPEFDQKLLDWLNQLRYKSRQGVQTPGEIVNLDLILNEMRLFKEPEEVENIRIAVDITLHAHRRAMRYVAPGRREYQVAAEIIHEFLARGASAPAYPPIVGGGANTCVLHYTENSATLADGDLVLIDAGAEYGFYAADITRTYPVNGKFSAPQAEIYNVVLAAQQAAIAEIYPGNRWIAPHNAAVETITRGLMRLGLLLGKLETLIEEEAYKRFFMHRTGHWLGIDVHDGGDYKIDNEWREFEPGMVMTVEPGVYVPASSDVAPQWWNIGIRIEDNVLVTDHGCEVLSQDLPRTIEEIEAFMAGTR